jgi:hypothetical protein
MLEAIKVNIKFILLIKLLNHYTYAIIRNLFCESQESQVLILKNTHIKY